MRTLLVTFCLLALGTIQARADMSVKEYQTRVGSKDQAVVAATQLYVLGLGEGIMWANTATMNALYCQPTKLALTKENYVDIVNRTIEEGSRRTMDRATEAKLNEASIGLLLIAGLRETFPCTGK